MTDPQKKEYLCPQCKRAIYERTMTICGYCGAELPKDFLLSAEEIAAMKKEREEHEAERRRMESEPKKSKRGVPAGPGEAELMP